MKVITTAIALALTAVLTSAASATPVSPTSSALRGSTVADDTHWAADFDVAVQQAREEGKNLLIDFTGSDWCSWCIKLHDEVFSKEEFMSYATENYVLVALDYPRSDEAKARVPNPERNQELAAKYEISGFPTVLLMTPDGDVFGRTGYQPGGAVDYVTHLTELREEGLKALNDAVNLVNEFEAAEGPARREALLKILAVVEGLTPESPIVGRLEGPVREAFVMDPENAEGLKLRALKALLVAGKSSDELMVMGRELDPKNASGVLELVVLAQFGKVEQESDLAVTCDALDALLAVEPIQATDKAIFMLANAAIWNAEFLNDPDRAKGYAARALDLEIEDMSLVSRLKEILEG